MSGSLRPAPLVFGDADYRDDDTYGLDLRTNMARRGDTIASATLAGVSRTDGQDMGDGDLAVASLGLVEADTVVPLPSGPVTAMAGMFVSWSASGGVAGVGYLVTVALTLTSGSEINRTCIINVRSNIG